ncbi:MAG: hypothetical protein ACLRFE_02525 [Clostridia bacterium]
MKKTTWTGNIVNGKVMPAKTEKIIDNAIISAMKAKLEEKELSL